MPCSTLIITGGGVIAGLDHRSWDKVCHCRPDSIWKMSTPSICLHSTPSTLCCVWVFRPISWFMGSLLCLARQKSCKSLAQDNWHPSDYFSNRSLKASSPAWFYGGSSGCKVYWSWCGRYMGRWSTRENLWLVGENLCSREAIWGITPWLLSEVAILSQRECQRSIFTFQDLVLNRHYHICTCWSRTLERLRDGRAKQYRLITNHILTRKRTRQKLC